MPFARGYLDIVQWYIDNELTKGHLMQLVTCSLSTLAASGWTQTAKWLLITDLSFPEGASTNDGSNVPVLTTMMWALYHLHNCVLHGSQLGSMAKVDIEAVYCLIPVHPQYKLYSGRTRSLSTPATIWPAVCHQNL